MLIQYSITVTVTMKRDDGGYGFQFDYKVLARVHFYYVLLVLGTYIKLKTTQPVQDNCELNFLIKCFFE